MSDPSERFSERLDCGCELAQGTWFYCSEHQPRPPNAGERLMDVVVWSAWAFGAVAAVLLVTWLLHFVLAWSWLARLGVTLGIGLVLAGISFARFVSDADSYR